MAMSFPLRFDGSGRTAQATGDAWVREALEQLLFTLQGERINRPDFGTNLAQLVFAANSPELAAATQLLTQGALQRWLGDRIAVDGLTVAAEGSVLSIRLSYRSLPLGEPATLSLSRDFAT